jgi:hypothetical protein
MAKHGKKQTLVPELQGNGYTVCPFDGGFELDLIGQYSGGFLHFLFSTSDLNGIQQILYFILIPILIELLG